MATGELPCHLIPLAPLDGFFPSPSPLWRLYDSIFLCFGEVYISITFSIGWACSVPYGLGFWNALGLFLLHCWGVTWDVTAGAVAVDIASL